MSRLLSNKDVPEDQYTPKSRSARPLLAQNPAFCFLYFYKEVPQLNDIKNYSFYDILIINTFYTNEITFHYRSILRLLENSLGDEISAFMYIS